MDNKETASYRCDEGWAGQELIKADFGDPRLTKRMVKVAEDLSARPEVPINHACQDWAATKAAYRLLSNEKVTQEELFSVHQNRTRQRLQGEEVVLAVQDSTYFNYDEHDSCKGLGYIGKENLKGVMLHHTLALTPLGLPLGVLTQEMTTRLEVKRLSPQQRKNLPIEQKESYRWIKALRTTVKASQGAKQVVTKRNFTSARTNKGSTFYGVGASQR